MKLEDVHGLIDYDFSGKRAMGNIYFLSYKGELVYVGKTKNIDSRISQHTMLFDSVKYLPVPMDDMDRLEVEYIQKFKPIFNVMDVVKKAPQFLFSKQGFMLWKRRKQNEYAYRNGCLYLNGKLCGAYNSKKVVFRESRNLGYEFCVETRKYTKFKGSNILYVWMDIKNVSIQLLGQAEWAKKKYGDLEKPSINNFSFNRIKNQYRKIG